jgi:preprotein translocase subunit YajC
MMPILSIILQAQRPNMLPFVIQFVAIIAIFWFLLIRPQRKLAQQHQQILAALKKGDEVMTEGGIIGSVVHIAEDRVTIKSAESTRLVVMRSKIARVLNAQAGTGTTGDAQ